MVRPVTKPRKIRAFLAIFLLFSAMALGSFAAAFEPITIPLEVKEPLEILDYPSGFSLYPGENATFEITVENHGPITYFIEFDFVLNDTKYQERHATFSSYNYSIAPGVQKLPAWLFIEPEAPSSNLTITVHEKTDNPLPSPSPTADSIMPSVELLSGGARWAARDGTSALYINWNDNWAAHHLTDGADWEWFSEESRNAYRSRITTALTQSGFEITYSGDIPYNIGDYDLVVIFAYYAAEPGLAELIRNYIANGAGVVLLAGVPAYFTGYSKTLSTGTDLTAIHEWLGCSRYANSGGSVRPALNNPFGTSLSTNDILVTSEIPWCAGVTSLNEDSQPIAFWSSGLVAAFTHEYGAGRVYYQMTV